MGLSRPSIPLVKQWLRASFKVSSTSSSPASRHGPKAGNEDEESTSDTVSLYDDTGAVSYNFSPVDEETNIIDARAPSLSVMLNDLERDNRSSSSIMTEMVSSMSSLDLKGEGSTPTLFASPIAHHNEDEDSVAPLLSEMCDQRDDEDHDERNATCTDSSVFEEWRKGPDSRRGSDCVSPRLSRHHSDPVLVYQAKHDDFGGSDRNNLARDRSHRSLPDDSAVVDDCTLSSAETALVSNKSAGSSSKDWGCQGGAKQRLVRSKRQPAKRARWMVVLRNHRYLSSLSAVMEEDEALS